MTVQQNSSCDNDVYSTKNNNIPHRGSLCKVHLTPSESEENKANAGAGVTSPSAIHNNNFIFVIKIYCSANGISTTTTTTTTTTMTTMTTTQPSIEEEDDYAYDNLFGNVQEANEFICDGNEEGYNNNNNTTTTTTNTQKRRICELRFEQDHYHFLSNLFSILDTESRGIIEKESVLDFVNLRCPVFGRRDNALRQQLERDGVSNGGDDGGGGGGGGENNSAQPSTSLTFEEVWTAVIGCSITEEEPATSFCQDVEDKEQQQQHGEKIGLEGWMVFCRFVALAQYQEAKRRFSSRHLQQTMRQKNEKRGNEVILVNVPPPEPPATITVEELVEYETFASGGIPLPELDLDHSYVSAHDMRHSDCNPLMSRGMVKIDLFGKSNNKSLNSPFSTSSDTNGEVDFAVRFFPHGSSSPEDDDSTRQDSIVVKRTFADMEWLHENFISQKKLGGTLCGRILPPFPAPMGTTTSDYTDDPTSQQSNSNTAAIASAGVGMITSAAKSAKSFLSGYIPTTTATTSTTTGATKNTLISKSVRTSRVRSYVAGKDGLGDTSISKAHQLERYLNFLLEHPALSTSFPLNVLLKASQSGLECAKKVLDKNIKNDRRLVSRQNLSSDSEEKAESSSYYAAFGLTSSKVNANNLTWVRTAAQAALALQLHGVLETTGYQSASAKLLHASLPKLPSGGQSMWHDTDGVDEAIDTPMRQSSGNTTTNNTEVGDDADDFVSEFEKGVISVKSELGQDGQAYDGSDEYDLLPTPIAVGKSALCAGSNSPKKQLAALSELEPNLDQDFGDLNDYDSIYNLRSISTNSESQQGYRYGVHDNVAVLGDMSVDRDIDRLRNVLRSLNNTLGKCLDATVGISEAIRYRTGLHLNILKALDSYEGMRGEIISQRALLLGVSNLEKSYEVTDASAVQFSRDLSWNTSLASAAVSASEEVRDAVKVYRRASRAKAAADVAAKKGEQICKEGKFANANDARAAQVRSANLQSQAMHAAVVEHESRAAKRRATMALAHDVKCWNVHRKREILETCLKTAKAQRDAARESKDAWVQLKDGLLSLSSLPVSFEKRIDQTSRMDGRVGTINEDDEESAVIMQNTSSESSSSERQNENIGESLAEPQMENISENNMRINERGERSESIDVHSEENYHQALSFSQEFEPQGDVDGDVNPEHFAMTQNSYDNVMSHSNQSLTHPSLPSQSFHDALPNTDGSELEKELSFDQIPDQDVGDTQLAIESSTEDSPVEVSNNPLQTPEPEEYIAPKPIIDSMLLEPNGDLVEDTLNESERLKQQSPDLFSTNEPDEYNVLPPIDPVVPDDCGNSAVVKDESNSKPLQESLSHLGSLAISEGTDEPEPIIPPQQQLSASQSTSLSESKMNLTSASKDSEAENGNEMTDSMQSLVDGLMMWGGQWDSEDDLSLPRGMAASIAMEEGGLLE